MFEKCRLFGLLLWCSFFLSANAGKHNSSHAGASPLFFDPASYAAPVIQPHNFFHPDEFKVRDGLPNFFGKVKNGKADAILFFADGTHPLEAGGNLYTEAIARAMLKMKSQAGDVVHPLIAPLIADNWEDAKMVDHLSFATFSPDWEAIDPGKIESLNQFSGWFPYVMKAEKPGSWIKFRFKGTMLGFFDIGGP
jgi:hypothetical protein